MPISFQTGDLFQSNIVDNYSPRWIGQIYTVDLNLDGNSDLLLLGASYPSDGEPIPQPGLVAFGDGSGGYTVATEDQFPLSSLNTIHTREVVFGDFNGDKVPDIFIASHGFDADPYPGEQNRLYLSNSTNSWRDATDTLPVATDFSHGTSAADINGDGHLDIVVGNVPHPNPEQPYILVNDGAGNFSSNLNLLPTGNGQILNGNQIRITSELLYDLDQDGFADFVAGSFDSSLDLPKPAFILWNANGEFSESSKTELPLPQHFGADNSVYDIQPIDINNDGLKDLLIAFQKDVALGGWELQVLINQGDRNFVDQTDQYIPDETAQYGGIPSSEDAESQYWVQFIKLVDLNKDGRMDFVLDGRGITNAPLDFPVVYIQQLDNSFQALRVGEVAGDHTWLFGLYTQTVTYSGHFGFMNPGQQDGQLSAWTLPISIEPVLPIYTGFTDPVVRWGTTGDDSLYGGNGNDRLIGNAGSDFLYGEGGIDSAVFSQNASSYTVSRNEGAIEVRTVGGEADILTGIERLEFTDSALAFDLDGNAGIVVKMLGVVLGQENWNNKEYIGIGLDLVDNQGISFEALMEMAFTTVLGGESTNGDIVNLVYTNLYGQPPSDQQISSITAELLDSGAFSVGELGVLAANHDLNTANIGLVGLADTGIEYQVLN